MKNYILFIIIFSMIFFSCQKPKQENRNYLNTQNQSEKYYHYADFSQGLKNDLESLGFSVPTAEVEAPNFTLKTLNGAQVSLNSFQGKLIFLNFWGTWCYWCKVEMPSMQNLYNELKDMDFEIVAVNVGDSEQTARSYIKENNFTFPVLLDSYQAVAGMYGIRGYPTTFIIDKNGNYLAKFVGSREWNEQQVITIFKRIINGEY